VKALAAGAAFAALLGLVAVPADGVARDTAQAPAYHHGAAGVGDPYFPLLGNGGFDVRHYGLKLRYRPARHRLSGTVTVTAAATENLSRFDLDFTGMHVDAVTVNGEAATYERKGPELRITPAVGVLRTELFRVAVTYDGSPKTIVGSPIVFGAKYGWQYTKDGAFVGDEPNAAHTWFPCSDHPSDKATYTFDITVPRGRQVVANGELTNRPTKRAHTTTFQWRERKPMATYLATIDIGHWRFIRGYTPAGIKEIVAYDPALQKGIRRRHIFALTGRVTDFWAKKFGRYAFTSTGAIVDHVPHVGFSLETQTRPLYGFVPDPVTLSHELSHQWFGDSVSVATWRNIWLNEGFATFAEWLWVEHIGGPSTYRQAHAAYRGVGPHNRFWKQAVANPKRNTMFSDAVYNRGGMTMALLRHRIGDHDFFRLLHVWTARHRYGNGTTGQFVHLAAVVSGQRLHRFFHRWLWMKRKPAHFG
jgi:aminopeptidase N